jgi:hypothetical protein
MLFKEFEEITQTGRINGQHKVLSRNVFVAENARFAFSGLENFHKSAAGHHFARTTRHLWQALNEAREFSEKTFGVAARRIDQPWNQTVDLPQQLLEEMLGLNGCVTACFSIFGYGLHGLLALGGHFFDVAHGALLKVLYQPVNDARSINGRVHFDFHSHRMSLIGEKSMATPSQKNRPYPMRRTRKKMRVDRVEASHFDLYRDGGFFCDHCSHFAPQARVCSLGYKPQHQQIDMLKNYELSGHVTFCRALEVD